MRFLPRAILAAGTGFAVSFLAACGGGGNGLLSGGQANVLQTRLNQISRAVGARNCVRVDHKSQQLASAVGSLPSTVNATVRNNLAQGAHTVAVLAMQECQKPTTTSTTKTNTTPGATTTTTTSSTTSSTTPTSTSTTSTATTPSTPTTTSTTPTTTTSTPTTPSGGGGLGGGNGGGNGQGNGNGNHD